VAVTRAVRRLLATALSAALVTGLVTGLGAAGWVAAPATSAPACPTPSLRHAIRDADVVFRGMVTKVKPVHGKAGHRTRTYKVAADRVYKKRLVTTNVLVTADVGTKCALPTLTQGSRYIFFTNEHGSKLIATPPTGRATPHFTHQVVQLLGSGKQPQTTKPPAATFQKVSDADPTSLTRLLAPGAALVIVCLLGLMVVGRTARRA
jgi:hypothetical protein